MTSKQVERLEAEIGRMRAENTKLVAKILELESILHQRNAEIARLNRRASNGELERQVRDQRRELDRMVRELREYRQKVTFFERRSA